MILLKDHNAETLHEALADLQLPERLVRQLHALAMKHSAREIPAELEAPAGPDPGARVDSGPHPGRQGGLAA
jgi:hypothetical protein